MNNGLESLLDKLKVRIRAEDPTAVEDAIRLTEQYPDEPDVWHTLAYGYGRERKYAPAIEAMTRAAELAPRAPAVFFHRGSYLLRAGEYERAKADFTEGLILCDEENDDYDREVLYFLRAEAFVQLGQKAEARADLAHVEDDCVLWTVQVRSKAELLALCTE